MVSARYTWCDSAGRLLRLRLSPGGGGGGRCSNVMVSATDTWGDLAGHLVGLAGCVYGCRRCCSSDTRRDSAGRLVELCASLGGGGCRGNVMVLAIQSVILCVSLIGGGGRCSVMVSTIET